MRGSYYRSDWNAPGYLSYQDLKDGKVKPTDRQPGPKLWGDGERFSLVLNRTPESEEAGWHFTSFVEKYHKRRANGSGAGYSMNNDDRFVYGGRLLYHFAPSPRWAVTVGADVRGDRGKGFTQVWPTPAGPSHNYNTYWDLNLLTYGLFGQAQWEVADGLKLTAGGRWDGFDYRINNRKRADGRVHYRSSVFTPRAGIVWSPVKSLELYANMGEGFRAPAEREISPAGATGPLGTLAGPTNLHVRAAKVKNRDIGFTAWLGPRVRVAGNVYETRNTNEIRQISPGIYAGVGNTTRRGWEGDVRVDVTDSLNFYASYGRMRGRLNTPTVPGQNRIQGLPEHTYRLGVEYTTPLAGGTFKVNGDAYQTSGKPYYSGTSTTPLFGDVYRRYDLRLTYEKGPVTVSAYGTFQPKPFGGEEAVSYIDPRPRSDVGVAVTYRF